jgi:predicted permease
VILSKKGGTLISKRGVIPKKKQSGLRGWEQIGLYSAANVGVWVLGSGIIAYLFKADIEIRSILTAIITGFFCILIPSAVALAAERKRK